MNKTSDNRTDGNTRPGEQSQERYSGTTAASSTLTHKLKSTRPGESSTVSRRTMLGVCATAGVGLGALGMASISRPARAQVAVEVADESVTLSPDETVNSVTLSGTIDATYSVTTSNADNAVITVGVGDTAGEGIAGGYEDYAYDDLDPDSGTITQDVELTFSVPPEVADPAAGSAIETEFFVDVYFWLADADASMLAEVVDTDTATLQIAREADDGNDTTGTAPPDLQVGGSFSFTVHRE